jgi:hypothetical protein
VTLDAWLAARRPEPPTRLAARVRECLAGERTDSDDCSAACASAGESLLKDLLARAETGRESALDLLTVDALLTYAFEACAESPEQIEARALDAMRRLAAAAA